jgi:hypothetical protein
MGPRRLLPRPSSTRRRRPRNPSAAIAHEIERGLIGPVESVMHRVPYGLGSGWSTREQPLPSEPHD